METEFKITTLRECANDELIEKVNALTEPLQINLVNRLLDKTFGELSYLDSTFLRDILKLDLNLLALNFCK